MIRTSTTGGVPEPFWFKSSYSSGPDGDSCVEVTTTPATVHVRDSKQGTAGHRLALTPHAWEVFVRAL
ncbi:DUF397 domain-containing protein [Streptomyces actuosus]|uniref:DUF397 domain-containing protein n=1 Tax=Streptomyces actuosus TaxID=1885 RepID=A0ABS2VME2_STRAS|nr:DUF397 domain-containing protein [Streptomyces actuosus]MBN0044190.1 DUF397 domain-containing protein [Streptomyces actuosus]